MFRTFIKVETCSLVYYKYSCSWRILINVLVYSQHFVMPPIKKYQLHDQLQDSNWRWEDKYV